MEADKKVIAELEMVKHDKEAEIKIVEKKTSGLVITDVSYVILYYYWCIL